MRPRRGDGSSVRGRGERACRRSGPTSMPTRRVAGPHSCSSRGRSRAERCAGSNDHSPRAADPGSRDGGTRLRDADEADAFGCASPGRRIAGPIDAPFDTVVLMMENRSSDHVLGWLPGANGRQAGLVYADIDGVHHETWPLVDDPSHDFYRCDFGDPVHDWQGIAIQYNGGRCDGFLRTSNPGDRFPIGYYREGDLPILDALAEGYTTLDNTSARCRDPPGRTVSISSRER